MKLQQRCMLFTFATTHLLSMKHNCKKIKLPLAPTNCKRFVVKVTKHPGSEYR